MTFGKIPMQKRFLKKEVIWSEFLWVPVIFPPLLHHCGAINGQVTMSKASSKLVAEVSSRARPKKVPAGAHDSNRIRNSCFIN